MSINECVCRDDMIHEQIFNIYRFNKKFLKHGGAPVRKK